MCDLLINLTRLVNFTRNHGTCYKKYNTFIESNLTNGFALELLQSTRRKKNIPKQHLQKYASDAERHALVNLVNSSSWTALLLFVVLPFKIHARPHWRLCKK